MATGSGGGNSGGVRAGKAFVELYAKDAGLQGALARAQAGVRSAGRVFAVAGAGIAAAGTGALGAVGGVFAAALGRANEVGTLATKLGVSTSELSKFAYAVGLGGDKLGELEGHFENFAERIYQAKAGAGEAAEAFRKLGITTADLASGDQLQILQRTLGQLEKVGDNDRLGIMSSLGGDKFQELNKAINGFGGMAGIKARIERAKLLGEDLADSSAASAAQITTAWHDTQTATKNAVLAVGEALFPYKDGIAAALEQVVRFAAGVRGWIKDNGQLVAVVAAGAAAAVALGGAFIAVGTTLAAAAAAAAGFVAAVGAIGGAVSAIAGAVTTGALAPFILIPIALAAAGAALLAFTESGRQLMGELWAGVKALFADTIANLVAGWEGVLSAFRRGDLSMAFAIGLGAAKVEWARLGVWVTDWWNGLKIMFVDGFRDVVTSFRSVWIDAVAGLAKVLAELWAKYDPTALDLKETLRGIELDRQVEQRKLAAERKQQQAESDTARGESLDRANADLAAAQAEQRNLLGENAARQRQFDIDRISKMKAAEDKPAAMAAAQVAARGTFGGQANALFFGLGVGPAEKQLTALKGIRDVLIDIRDKLPAEGLAFGEGTA